MTETERRIRERNERTECYHCGSKDVKAIRRQIERPYGKEQALQCRQCDSKWHQINGREIEL